MLITGGAGTVAVSEILSRRYGPPAPENSSVDALLVAVTIYVYSVIASCRLVSESSVCPFQVALKLFTPAFKVLLRQKLSV